MSLISKIATYLAFWGLVQACTAADPVPIDTESGNAVAPGAGISITTEMVYVKFPVADSVERSGNSVTMTIDLDESSPYTRDEVNQSTWNLFYGNVNEATCKGLSESNSIWTFETSLADLFQPIDIDTSTWTTGVYYFCITSPELDFAFISGSLRISADGVPLAPTSLTGEKQTVNSIDLSWQDESDDETYFRLERKNAEDDNWQEIAQIASNSISYTDAAIVPDSSYDFRLFAVNDTGESPASETFSYTFTPEVAEVAAPFGLTFTARTFTTIDLQWTDASLIETSVDVERSNDGLTGWSNIANLSANSTSYQDTGLTQLTTYYYRVIAKNATATSAPSAVLSVATLGPPQVPADFKGSSKDQEIELSWASVQDVLVVRRSAGAVTWSPTDSTDYPLGTISGDHEIIYKGSAQSFGDTGLTNGSLYHYAVFSENGLLQYSSAQNYQGRPFRVTSVALGGLHMCATGDENSLFCWGRNGNGQLGIGSFVDQSSPSLVDTSIMQDHDNIATLSVTKDFAKVAMTGDAFATCSVNSDNGYAHCWGFNGNAKLGSPWHTLNGNESRPNYAVDAGGSAMIYANSGYDVGCGIDALNNGYCWGNNSAGAVGIGSAVTTNYNSAQALNTASKFTKITPADDVVCGLTTTNSIECWGESFYGTLGRGATPGDPTSPEPISVSRTWVDMGAGNLHACGLDNTGNVYCWGYDGLGAVGNDANDDGNLNTPTLVDMSALGGATFTKLSVGMWAACGLSSDNKIYCWGRDPLSRIAAGTNYFVPTEMFTTGLPSGFTIEELHIGYHDQFAADFGGKICALLSTGELYCTGSGSRGQLGQGDTTDHLTKFVKINF